MNHLTVRNVPPDLASALRREQRRRGASLNRTVLDLLRTALGLGRDGAYDNGLGRFAGTWSAREFAAFQRNIAALFERVDEEVWK